MNLCFFPVNRFWAHIVMAYVFTFWTFFVLYREYKVVTTMRLRFLAIQNRRADQFTVRDLSRNTQINEFKLLY